MYCVRKVNDDYTWIGADSRRLAVFEGVFGVPEGVSYNSYLLLDEKTVLFDTVDAQVIHQFRENLYHALDGRTLDYDLTMGGGLWLNGGHLWHITWTQGTGSTFAFYDADGRPLRILSGRSYIAWLSSLTGEEVTVQDSAGNDLLQP